MVSDSLSPPVYDQMKFKEEEIIIHERKEKIKEKPPCQSPKNPPEELM